jgi:hypothetical protein
MIAPKAVFSTPPIEIGLSRDKAEYLAEHLTI